MESAPDQDQGDGLSISYLFDVIKRRALYFAVPFLIVLAIGSLVTLAWPAKYLSQGKILISSQEIPKDLVKPTVTSLTNERIEYIQQRILTRDNLIALAKKFNLKVGWQGLVSGTEIVDFIRERTKIAPSDVIIQGERKQAIAFSIGFEYEQPQMATRVANELVTMILAEDVRSRTNFASETTKFLEKEVKRLEDQLSSINGEIAERQKLLGAGIDLNDDSRNLAALKAQLAIKSATYSESHPDIRALKRQIEALEKTPAPATKTPTGSNTDPPQKDFVAGNANPLGVDTLLTQRVGVRQELNEASSKLAAARLGESLERGQHSERLEVLEQPTVPRRPTSPNRPKILAIVFVLAIMAGGGLLVGAEAMNPAIRRSADLFTLVDSHLVVSIPYIRTREETSRTKSRWIYWTGGILVFIVLALIAIVFVLPPLDTVFEKIMTKTLG